MYSYETEKPRIFTEDGQTLFLEIRDRAHTLLDFAGAARLQEIIKGCTGDTWLMLACIDRLVELGEIKQIRIPGECATQHYVYIAA